MKVPDNDEFWRVATPLVESGRAVEGTLMRQRCLRAASNDEFAAAAHYEDSGMVIKLPADDVAAAIEAGVGKAFSIKTGSVFKEWLWVTLPSSEWLPWLEKALAYAEIKPKKRPKATKKKEKKPKTTKKESKVTSKAATIKPRGRAQRGGGDDGKVGARARSRSRTRSS